MTNLTEYESINTILANSNPIEQAFINNLFEDILDNFESYVSNHDVKPTFTNLINFMIECFIDNLSVCAEHSPVMEMMKEVFSLTPNVYDLFKDVKIKFDFYNSVEISNINFSNINGDDLHDIIRYEHFPTIDITFTDDQLKVLKNIDMLDFLGSLINEQTNIDCITVNGYAYDEVKECI